MLVAFIYEPFIHFIADAQGVMSDTEISNTLQLTLTENLCRAIHNFRMSKDHCKTKLHFCHLTFPIGLFGVLMRMAFVLELNLLASSSWSRTQSPLLILDVAVGFYRTSQLGDMEILKLCYDNKYYTIMKLNLPIAKVLKLV